MPAHKSSLPSPALIRSLGCLIKLVFGLTILLGMGYFALLAMNPKARQWATRGAKDGSGGPTPFKAVNQILAIPAQALGKTDDVVQANNARVGQLDGLIAEEEGKARGGKAGRGSRPVVDPFASAGTSAGTSPARAAASTEADGDGKEAVSRAAIIAMMEKLGRVPDNPGPPAPGAAPVAPAPVVAAPPPPEPAAPAQVKLAGGIVISSVAPAGAPEVRASFFYWIVNQNISGVLQGPPHRLMLNNRLVYAGDEINRDLGIIFDRLDPANKVIVFRDGSGAIVTRSY